MGKGPTGVGHESENSELGGRRGKSKGDEQQD